MSDVTRILSAIEQGDPHAAEQLLRLVYDELRKLAAQKLAREKPGQTLEATHLFHEAYVRLLGKAVEPHWNSRGHFFAAAAEAMRRILVEEARRKQSQKRGGALDRQDLEEAQRVAPTGVDVLEHDEALDRLAARDQEAARLAKLRFFAGMTMQEAAGALDLSERTAERVWAYARSFLRIELAPWARWRSIETTSDSWRSRITEYALAIGNDRTGLLWSLCRRGYDIGGACHDRHLPGHRGDAGRTRSCGLGILIGLVC